MSPDELRSALTELDGAIADARSRGQALDEADVRARKARLYSQVEQWREGAQELHWAAALACDAGRVDKQAEYLYGKGLLASKDPTLTDASLRALRRAKATARVIGREPLAQSALGLLGELLDKQGRVDLATQAMAEQLAGLENQGRSKALIKALQRHAVLCYRWNRQTPSPSLRNDALRSLSQAIAVAEHLSEAREALELRLDRRILRDHAWGNGAPFSSLLAELELDGDPNPFGGEPLAAAMEALQAGRLEEGLRRADEARGNALRAGDPQRYLLASLLLAEGRDLGGDRAGVLEVLLTCKGTLEQSQGTEAGGRLKVLLDALKGRWGTDETQAALQEYRSRIQASA
jgi:hypothetical protein